MENKTFTPSLSEVNQSVETAGKKTLGKKLLAFFGPAYLVSVGYMDPGNWATDLAGGSRYGYTLIWVLLMSNLIALLLQSLSARLGIVRSLDLAQASRENYPKAINIPLYILAEIAIAACDLAEVLGMAIGLQLLFDLPLIWGVAISALDTFLLLFLLNFGMRRMELFIMSLVFIIGSAFVVELFLAKPSPVEIAGGFIPSIPDSTALYIAIGIIGATVMPHNLYLHSSLVQTRKFSREKSEIRKAIRYNIFDSAIALNLAFFVNAAILILAAATFYKQGLFEVAEIQDAHKLLAPLLGTSLAPKLFAIALIAAGQSSTITGTLAGQVVMEGYLNLRIQPWLRRLITRLIAIIPAILTIHLSGEEGTGKLLILSQVILSIQLGFAIIPLIHFVSDKSKMKEFVINNWVKVAAWLSASIIVALNIRLVIQTLQEWYMAAGSSAWILNITLLPVVIGAGALLLYIALKPFFVKSKFIQASVPHGEFSKISEFKIKSYSTIAITLDFSESDNKTINHALSLGGKDAKYYLIHVVETAGALLFGQETRDLESQADRENLVKYQDNLAALGFDSEIKVGYGNRASSIAEIVTETHSDVLVMGAHGHKALKDLILGTTVDSVRHKINVPVLIVR